MDDCPHRWLSEIAMQHNERAVFISVTIGPLEQRETFEFDICVNCGKLMPMIKAHAVAG